MINSKRTTRMLQVITSLHSMLDDVIAENMAAASLVLEHDLLLDTAIDTLLAVTGSSEAMSELTSSLVEDSIADGTDMIQMVMLLKQSANQDMGQDRLQEWMNNRYEAVLQDNLSSNFTIKVIEEQNGLTAFITAHGTTYRCGC